MFRWQRLPLIVALPFVFASCTPASNNYVSSPASAVPTATAAPTVAPGIIPVATSAVAAAVPPASCSVTLPANPPFIPPSPYPPTPPPLYANEFWSGTEMLWTMLRMDGTWQKLPYHDGAYTQKVFWWRQGYDYRTDPEPNLSVTGRRLDAPAPPMQASGATNGSRGDIGSFMVVGVDIPTPGCWEITGQSAGAIQRFVVWIAP
ncbi:MAG: hypothetical protein ACR2M3_07390 [Thermomicrobiales bacterium]